MKQEKSEKEKKKNYGTEYFCFPHFRNKNHQYVVSSARTPCTAIRYANFYRGDSHS